MLKTARRGIDTNQEGHSPCLLMVSVMSAEFPFLRAQSNDHDGVTKRKHFCQSYQPCYDLVHPQFIHSVIATSFTGAQKLVIKPRDNADPGCASKHMALQCCTMLSCCYCVLLICAAIPRIAISLEGEEALPSRSNWFSQRQGVRHPEVALCWSRRVLQQRSHHPLAARLPSVVQGSPASIVWLQRISPLR